MRALAALSLLAFSPALAVPTTSLKETPEQKELREALDQVEAELLMTGPNVPTWNKSGIDLPELVAKAPGGNAGNYILVRSSDGSTRVELIDRSGSSAMIPESWSKVKDIGDSKGELEPRGLSFAILDGQHIMGLWSETRKVGDAFCSTDDPSVALYRDSAREAGDIPDNFAEMVFTHSFERLRNKPLCWRYDPQGNGFRISYFLPNGDSLPNLTADRDVATIVPAGDINALLKPGAPTP